MNRFVLELLRSSPFSWVFSYLMVAVTLEFLSKKGLLVRMTYVTFVFLTALIVLNNLIGILLAVLGAIP